MADDEIRFITKSGRELTDDDIEALADEAKRGYDIKELHPTELRVRQLIHEEIASLAGKALRRAQDRSYSRDPERNMMQDVVNTEVAEFWGEVLAEYGLKAAVDKPDEDA